MAKRLVSSTAPRTSRDNKWLLYRLEKIWDTYFPDIKQLNRVYVRFGQRSRTRFGSIRLRYEDNSSHIMVTSMFKDPQYPVEVIDHTLAHELVHYTHGFSSPYPRLHRFPHRGGVIDHEMKKRGMGHLVDYYKKWVDSYAKTL